VDGQTEGGVEVAVAEIGCRWDGWCDADRRTDGPRLSILIDNVVDFLIFDYLFYSKY
jgi:hypothetical protein